MGTYTWSHFTEKVFRLNATDADFEKRLVARRRAAPRHDEPSSTSCRSARAASSRRDAGGCVNALIGGWSVNAIGQFQSGRPLDFGGRNIYFNGNLDALKAKYTEQQRRAGVRHQRLLLPRRRGADQRRGRPGQAAHRPAHQPGEQRPLLPVARRRHPQPVPQAVGHLDRQAGADRRPRARAVQHRVPERLQRGRLQRREHRPDATPTSAR